RGARWSLAPAQRLQHLVDDLLALIERPILGVLIEVIDAGFRHREIEHTRLMHIDAAAELMLDMRIDRLAALARHPVEENGLGVGMRRVLRNDEDAEAA